MPRGDGYGGRRAQRWVALVLATYGQTCHLCHHPGADSADHLQPRASHPQLMYVVTNGRPVHHRPCPTCGVRCNIRRKAKPLQLAPDHDSLAFFDSSPPARAPSRPFPPDAPGNTAETGDTMTTPHRYGPHRPEDAPNAVRVLSGGTRTGTPVRTEVVPLPAELVRQRETINQLAHFSALLATVTEPCRHGTRRASGECASCGSAS